MNLNTPEIHINSVVGRLYLAHLERTCREVPSQAGFLCDIVPAVVQELFFKFHLKMILAFILVGILVFSLIVIIGLNSWLIPLGAVIVLGIINFLAFIYLGLFTLGILIEPRNKQDPDTIQLASYSWVALLIIAFCELVVSGLISHFAPHFLGTFRLLNTTALVCTSFGLILLLWKFVVTPIAWRILKLLAPVLRFIKDLFRLLFYSIKDRICIQVKIVVD